MLSSQPVSIPDVWRTVLTTGAAADLALDRVVGVRAIAMVSGEGGTGLAGYEPQVKYARGRVVQECVQGTLWDTGLVDEADLTLWFLLHKIDADDWKAELSRPASIGKGGWVTRWHERIQIVAEDPGSSPDGRISAPELPEPTVRWRDSA